MTERELKQLETSGEWLWEGTCHGLWYYIHQHYDTKHRHWVVSWKKDGRYNYAFQKFTTEKQAAKFFARKFIELDELEKMIDTEE